MKKKAEPHPSSHLHVICPFCGYPVNHHPTITPWCSDCGIEFYINRNLDVVFDDRRKTPRFALAKAVQQAVYRQDQKEEGG